MVRKKKSGLWLITKPFRNIKLEKPKKHRRKKK